MTRENLTRSFLKICWLNVYFPCRSSKKKKIYIQNQEDASDYVCIHKYYKYDGHRPTDMLTLVQVPYQGRIQGF